MALFGVQRWRRAAIALLVRVVSARTDRDMVNGARKLDADLAWHAQILAVAAFEARKLLWFTPLNNRILQTSAGGTPPEILY